MKKIYCAVCAITETRLELFTNGLLIPNLSYEKLKCIKDNNVIVSVTAYAPTKKIMKKIKDTLQEYGIHYIINLEEENIKFNKTAALLVIVQNY